MSPADVLEAAADALFVHGRARGMGRKPDGSMCVVGAIQFVQGNNPRNVLVSTFCDPARVALQNYVGHDAAWAWSDRQLGAEGDALVIDTLRRCSKALREVEA